MITYVGGEWNPDARLITFCTLSCTTKCAIYKAQLQDRETSWEHDLIGLKLEAREELLSE